MIVCVLWNNNAWFNFWSIDAVVSVADAILSIVVYSLHDSIMEGAFLNRNVVEYNAVQTVAPEPLGTLWAIWKWPPVHSQFNSRELTDIFYDYFLNGTVYTFFSNIRL